MNLDALHTRKGQCLSKKIYWAIMTRQVQGEYNGLTTALTTNGTNRVPQNCQNNLTSQALINGDF